MFWTFSIRARRGRGGRGGGVRGRGGRVGVGAGVLLQGDPEGRPDLRLQHRRQRRAVREERRDGRRHHQARRRARTARPSSATTSARCSSSSSSTASRSWCPTRRLRRRRPRRTSSAAWCSATTTTSPRTTTRSGRGSRASGSAGRYFTFDHTFTPKLTTRFRLEVNSNGKLAGGALTPYVKDAYLRWTYYGRQQVTLGIQPTLSFDFVESVLGPAPHREDAARPLPVGLVARLRASRCPAR